MFEIFLNTAKFIVSDDVRKSTSSLIDMIHRSPEWQKDICTMNARIQNKYYEQAIFLLDLTMSKMQNMEFKKSSIDDFKIVFSELIRNAFNHGCKEDNDEVKITIEITKTFVSLIVINPKKRKFLIEPIIKNNLIKLQNNPNMLSGRGLLLVRQLTDSFIMVNDNTGVKIVIYSDRVILKTDIIEDLIILNIEGGFYNPALSGKLMSEIKKTPPYDIVINLNKLSLDTEVLTIVIRLNLNLIGSRKVVVLIDECNLSKTMLPKEITSTSWAEALIKIGKMNLLPKLLKY